MTEAAIPCFDAHCDTISLCTQDGRFLRQNAGHLDLTRLRRFSKAGQVFALFADRDGIAPGGLFARCERMHGTFISELCKNGDIAAMCANERDISAANRDGKIAAMLSIEGGELLDCDPARLETAKSWGVRSINLTWNHANRLSGSHIDQPEQGLTALGKAWVRESDRLHILADVSHLSDRGFWDVAVLTTQPIFASHSNARSIAGHSRNLTDDMFRTICQSGGVAGLNFYSLFIGGSHGMDDILRHIEHFLTLGGEKHLALGGDWDGCDSFAGGMRGIQDIPLLWDFLSHRGYDRALLEDIFYNNLCRVLG